jgi:hypothetical protein
MNRFHKLSLIILSLLGCGKLSAQLDVHGPKPFVEILDLELTSTWTPAAISAIENRKHVILLDAATQSNALSISASDPTTLTVTAMADITDTYGNALRCMFQLLDRNATELATETLTSTYSLHSELSSYSAIDASAVTGSSTAASVIMRDTGSYYRDDQTTVAYLIFTPTGTPSSTTL